MQCFRDMADKDYILGRMAFKAQLMPQFFWQGLQAVEKYLKCILLLHRIPSKDMGHDINKGIDMVANAEIGFPQLSEQSKRFSQVLFVFGSSRYLEKGYNAYSRQLIYLDQLVAEVRRCCKKPLPIIKANLMHVRLERGALERIIDNRKDAAHEPLIWQNAYFGVEPLNKVALPNFQMAERPILAYKPGLVEELSKYVFLPNHTKKSYRCMANKTIAADR